MSSSEDVLTALVDLLATEVSPAPVVIDDGHLVRTDLQGTVLRPVALVRVGRSRRGGAILDLELTVEVTTHGPKALATMERHLVTIERSQPGARAEPSSSDRSPADDLACGLSVVVILPVAVCLTEPQPPLVTQQPVVEVHFVTSLDGVLLDMNNHPIIGAVVRLAATGVTCVSDKAGRFRLLTTTGAPGPASIEVTVRGQRHLTTLEFPHVDGLSAKGIARVILDAQEDSHEFRSDVRAEV